MADHFGPLSEIRVFAQNRSAQLPGGRSADQNGPQTAVQGLSEQAAIASFQPATNLLQCPLKQRMPLLWRLGIDLVPEEAQVKAAIISASVLP